MACFEVAVECEQCVELVVVDIVIISVSGVVLFLWQAVLVPRFEGEASEQTEEEQIGGRCLPTVVLQSRSQ